MAACGTCTSAAEFVHWHYICCSAKWGIGEENELQVYQMRKKSKTRSLFWRRIMQKDAHQIWVYSHEIGIRGAMMGSNWWCYVKTDDRTTCCWLCSNCNDIMVACVSAVSNSSTLVTGDDKALQVWIGFSLMKFMMVGGHPSKGHFGGVHFFYDVLMDVPLVIANFRGWHFNQHCFWSLHALWPFAEIFVAFRSTFRKLLVVEPPSIVSPVHCAVCVVLQ